LLFGITGDSYVFVDNIQLVSPNSIKCSTPLPVNAPNLLENPGFEDTHSHVWISTNFEAYPATEVNSIGLNQTIATPLVIAGWTLALTGSALDPYYFIEAIAYDENDNLIGSARSFVNLSVSTYIATSQWTQIYLDAYFGVPVYSLTIALLSSANVESRFLHG